MKPKVLLIYPGNERLGESIVSRGGYEKGEFVLRSFPDGETYFRFLTEVKGKEVYILCSLDRPNEKMMPLFLMARMAREQGASGVKLIAPYLAYMRQDKVFKPGESIIAKHFAAFLASCFDSLITVDPHLHRIRSLTKIYPVPVQAVHSASLVASWISQYIPRAFLIGPDAESKQWVSQVAKESGCTYIVAKKQRMGDRQVNVALPDLSVYRALTPVLIDDIISTGNTMKEIIRQLKEVGMPAPICIGVHAVFAGQAYEELLVAGVAEIITCNTIAHPSNRIDISGYLPI